MKHIFFIFFLLFDYAYAQNLPPYKPMLAGTINEWWLNQCFTDPDYGFLIIFNVKFYADASKTDSIEDNVYQRFYRVKVSVNPPDTMLAGYMREDTAERKVYFRGTAYRAPEVLFWNFKILFQDSVDFPHTACGLPVIANPPIIEKQEFGVYPEEKEIFGEKYRMYGGQSPDIYEIYEGIGSERYGPFPPSCKCGDFEHFSRLIYRRRDDKSLYGNYLNLNDPCLGWVGRSNQTISKTQKAYYDSSQDKIVLLENASSLQLYDATGRQIYIAIPAMGIQTIDLKNLDARGVLFLQIETFQKERLYLKIYRP